MPQGHASELVQGPFSLYTQGQVGGKWYPGKIRTQERWGEDLNRINLPNRSNITARSFLLCLMAGASDGRGPDSNPIHITSIKWTTVKIVIRNFDNSSLLFYCLGLFQFTQVCHLKDRNSSWTYQVTGYWMWLGSDGSSCLTSHPTHASTPKFWNRSVLVFWRRNRSSPSLWSDGR